MDEPHEKIEVGLDSRTDQITIVVGTDHNTVQSVVVLLSKGKKHPNNRFRSRCAPRSPSLSQQLSALKDRRSFRSELLRPDSPLSLRSNVVEGRGRDSARDDRNTLRRYHHHGRSLEPRHSNTTTSPPTTTLSGPTRTSLFVGKNHRKSKRNMKTPNPIVDLDSSHGYNNNNLPALKEGYAYVQENNNEHESKPRFYRRTFRHHRVDPVLVMEDSR